MRRIRTGVSRRGWRLPVALAAMLLVVRAGAFAGAAEAVPLVKGLVFTTTSHAGLATTAGSVAIADTEAVYWVTGADDDRVSFQYSFSAPGDAAAGRLLEAVPHQLERQVRREDLRSAARLTVMYGSSDSPLMAGQTFATASSAVLQTLHDAGKTAFVLGVNEPEQGIASLGALAGPIRPAGDPASGQAFVASGVATLMSSLGVTRHYYRGTLERVAVEPFPVLLGGRRTTVPALHARGTLTFTDRTIAPQFWWLDDVKNPITLKWTIGSVYETVTRINWSAGPTMPATQAFAEALAGQSCRAELTGVYFTTASAQVLDASRPALERFAAVVKAHPDWQLSIDGHTDNIGSPASNLDLSARRSAAVRDVLIRRFGVAAARLKSQGFGLTRPIETNATDEGRARNRRVEVSRQCR